MEATKGAREFTAKLESAMGERLRSVLLYGSVPRGEAVEGVSDVNVLVLLDRVDAETLKMASPLARRWAEAGNTAPLLFAWNEWRRAADVFAIEAADMRDAHELLYGDDPLDGPQVDGGSLRLQAERELRGKLLQLREGMLLSAGKPEHLGALLLLALPSFTTYLRAALRLGDRPVPPATPDVIRAGGELVGAPVDALLECWQARSEGRRLPAALDSPLTNGYYALAEQMAAYVDSLTRRDA